ncbi:MAG: hypothetical protein M3331_00250 [Actinomycetota bacterium]|nr:hypothetical protein [Actinomycetota bacterium]
MSVPGQLPGANQPLTTEEHSTLAQVNARIESLEQRLVSIIGFAGFTLPLLGGFSAEQIATAHDAADTPAKGAAALDLEELGLPWVGNVELVTSLFFSALVFLAVAIYVGVRLLRRSSVVPGLGSEGISQLRALEKDEEVDVEETIGDVYLALIQVAEGRLADVSVATRNAATAFAIGLALSLATVGILIFEI